jgi:cyclopropane-fatty-acyl-phospholipid synthase
MASTPLRRALAGALPYRPFAISFWDGTQLPASADALERPLPTFTVRSPQALAHLVGSPSRLGLGRAYVAGDLDSDDLDRAFAVIDSFELPRLSLKQRARLVAAIAIGAAAAGRPKRPAIELILRGERHSAERDRAAVRYHYDVGNDFFALFLDRSMTYSCALFRDGAKTLEEAQEAKHELVCQKLGLRAGERVLDVGCGWGSFAMHAASRHGVSVLGITLSEEQARLARERVVAAGLSAQVEIRLCDYRELREAPFDAISSIGMVEHVGERMIDTYARTLAGHLRAGGRLLNHGIASLTLDYDAAGDAFTNRYVFPDGEPLHLSRIQGAFEHAGLVTKHIEGFARDYAITLSHWARRLDESLERAIAIAGEERTRVWRLYLRAARAGFETGFTAVYQVLAAKPA